MNIRTKPFLIFTLTAATLFGCQTEGPAIEAVYAAAAGECNQGFGYVNGQCVSCAGSCASCDSAPGTCTRCAGPDIALQPNEVGVSCEECDNINNCARCADHYCQECDPGFGLVDVIRNNKKVATECRDCTNIDLLCTACDGGFCTACSNDKTVTPDGRNCVDAVDLEARGQCVAGDNFNQQKCGCPFGTGLIDNACKPCANGFNCISCGDDPQKCTQCGGTLAIQVKSDGTEPCVLCSQIPNCTSCKNSHCQACAPNYGLTKDRSCQACSDIDGNCTRCENGYCLECKSGALLASGKGCRQ